LHIRNGLFRQAVIEQVLRAGVIRIFRSVIVKFAARFDFDDRQRLFRYCGRELSAADVPAELIRLAMMSAADTVIIPLQDVLALGEEARMNRPSTARDNWEWRLLPEQLQSSAGDFLQQFTYRYGRE